MDSKSIPPPDETTTKQGESDAAAERLRKTCADPDVSALVALLPALAPKQVRQLLALARSMADAG